MEFEIMPRKVKRETDRMRQQRIARLTRKRLTTLIIGLLIPLTLLGFRVGEAVWPDWLAAIRPTALGLLCITTVFIAAMSPIIVVTESDPRPLNGPGKNPSTPPQNHEY